MPGGGRLCVSILVVVLAASTIRDGVLPHSSIFRTGWDETNSTYYVRFTGDSESLGDSYIMIQVDRAARAGVATNVPTLIYNTKTKRPLGWRQEGEDEWFLVEVSDTDPLATPATFLFVRSENVLLPCPRIFGARCEAYNLESQKYGLLPIYETGATYIKAGNPSTDEVQPFILRESSSTSSYIKTVLQ